MTNTGASKRLSTGFILKLFIPFALGFFLSAVFRNANAILAPKLIAEFHLTAADLGLMTSILYLSFALTQFPFGISLDRYGARRTLAFFLLFAVTGSFVFAYSTSINQLMLGRGLIGIGVAGCLMAAFKAFSEWVAYDKITVINSALLFVAGGLGMTAVTKPINWALNFTDWRGIFMFLGFISLVAVILIYFVVPRKPVEGDKNEPIISQIMGIGHILKSASFWRLAPSATLIQGTYIALNSLWIGTWLKDVAGYSKNVTADWLFYNALGVTFCLLLQGLLAERLQTKFGFKTLGTCTIGMAVCTISLGLLGLFNAQAGVGTFMVAIGAGTFSVLSYPVFSAMFESKYAGRVITLYNLMVFVVGFGVTWLMGVVIDKWPAIITAAGKSYNPEGYKAAMLILFAINAAALVWLFVFRKGKLEFFAGKQDSNKEKIVG